MVQMKLQHDIEGILYYSKLKPSKSYDFNQLPKVNDLFKFFSSEKLFGLTPSTRLLDPCLAADYEEVADVEFNVDRYDFPAKYKILLEDHILPTGEENTTKLFLKGTGDWELCYQSLKEFTLQREKYSKCSDVTAHSCPTEGVNVPTIQFDKAEFYAFSEFWYSMEDVLRMGGPYIYNKLKTAAKVGF